MKNLLISKKILISLSLAPVIGLPIATLVACDNKKTISKPKILINDFKLESVKPLDFRKIFTTQSFKENEPIFLGGINYTAYTQGMSLLFNILQGLGWNWHDQDKIYKLYDSNFDFSTIRPSRAKNSKIDLDHKAHDGADASNQINKFESDLTNAFEIYYEKGLNQFIAKKANLVPQSKLYNQIRLLEVITKEANNFDKVDCTTEVKIDLGSGFKDLELAAKFKLIANKLNTKEIATKIFNNKKYAYTWDGNLLRKLGFQIQTRNGSTIMLLWQLSDGLPQIYKNLATIRGHNSKMQQFFDQTPLAVKNQKNLDQVIIDPLGVSGTMPQQFFFTNTNLKHNSTAKRKHKYFYNSWRIYKFGGDYDWSAGKNPKWPLQLVSSFNSFIDADHPGTIVLKGYSGKGIDNSSKTVKVNYPLQTLSTSNRIQTFYKLKNEQKIKQMGTLVFKFIKFLQTKARQKTKEITYIEQLVSPTISSLFEFLRNNELSEEQIYNQFLRCNNGSHYMLGVEIFFRGMIGIPTHLSTNFQVPSGIKLYLSFQNKDFKRKDNEIVGMVNVKNILPILYLTYSAGKEGTVNTIYNFNPATTAYENSKLDVNYFKFFIKDKSSSKKSGQEIAPYNL